MRGIENAHSQSFLIGMIGELLIFFKSLFRKETTRVNESLLNTRHLGCVNQNIALEIIQILYPEQNLDNWSIDSDESDFHKVYIQLKPAMTGVLVCREGVFFLRSQHNKDPEPFPIKKSKEVFKLLRDNDIDISRINKNGFMFPQEETKAFKELCEKYKLNRNLYIPAKYRI